MIGIVVAMSEELTRILFKSNIIYIDDYLSYRSFFACKICDKDVVLTVSGIGKVNSSLATQYMIDNYKVSSVINIGVAGSLDKNIEVGDIVIGSSYQYHDFDSDLMITSPPFTDKFISDNHLRDKAISCIKDFLSSKDPTRYKSTKIETGTIVSGDEFVTSNDRKLSIINRFPEAKCVDMESTSIAHVCYENNIPFLSIRCMSDSADDSVDKDYSNHKIKSSDLSAEFLLCMLNYF